MELGIHTTYNPRKVVKLKKFIFYKATDIFIQQHTKRFPVTGGYPLSVVTETSITKDVSKDQISITSIGTAFTVEMEQNLENLFCKNEKNDARIKDLKEKLIHTMKYEGSLR